MRRYGVSAVSMFPYSWGPGGPLRAKRMAFEAGYSGIQAMPLRGWMNTPLKHWEGSVLSFEDAWNYGPVWQIPLRHLGLKSDGPTLMDWLLFGSRVSPYFPNAIPSVHHKQLGVATEIHPELSTSVFEYLDYTEAGGKLVWDTWHVRRPYRDGKPGIRDWRELMDRLPSESIALIHVHVTKDDLQGFMSAAGELTHMLRRLRLKVSKSVPAIIEIAPPLRSWDGTLGFLSDVRQQAFQLLR